LFDQIARCATQLTPPLRLFGRLIVRDSSLAKKIHGDLFAKYRFSQAIRLSAPAPDLPALVMF
jgi:hypothetical protein